MSAYTAAVKMKRALAAMAFPSIMLCTLGAAMLTASAASAADQPAATAVVPGQAQTSADEKTICKKIVITGTRFAKSDCRTAREWDIVERKSRGNADEYVRKTSEAAGIAPDAAIDGGGGRSMGVLSN